MKSKGDSAQQKLLKLQHRVYRSLQTETDLLLGKPPASIQKYEKEYAQDFRVPRESIRVSDKESLVEAIRESDVTWIADFHTFNQAQRTALRLMREAALPGENWMIGLELIPSHHQAELDRFQAGKIALKKFHETIQYESQWGFPWSNYAPIFDWAREAQVPLIALNRPKELDAGSATLHQSRDGSDLHERDRWAAGLITDLFAANGKGERGGKKLRMIVLYGELHIASKHLPARLTEVSRDYLGKPLRSLCVHQNQDQLYWRLARQGKAHDTSVLKIKRNSFCVVSSTPWTKLQSLINWAEGGNFDAQHEDFDEISAQLQVDYLSIMSRFGKSLSEFFGVEAPSFDGLNLKTLEEADFIEDLGAEQFSQRERSLIAFHVENNLRLYVPRVPIAYLGSPSLNGAAELAAIHLQRARTRSAELQAKDPDDFFRQILEAAFGFLGSLVLNPKRKCDLIADHETRLKELRSGEKESFRGEQKARALTLSFLQAEERIVRDESPRLKVPGPSNASMMAARFIGQVLGKRAHLALLSGTMEAETIRRVCLARMDGSGRPNRERFLELFRGAARQEIVGSKAELL